MGRQIKMTLIAAFLLFFQQQTVLLAAQPEQKATQDVQSDNTFVFDTVVVSATRIQTSVMDVPASVTVITAKDIEAKNITSVQEALKNETGILYNPVSEEIQMRGRQSDDILVLVEGVPSFMPFNNDANLEAVPIDNIERIEVVRGPASSLYGGNAVSGVINIITKNPDKNSVNVRLSGGSQNTWIKDISVNQKISDKFGIGLGWESRTSDGYMQRYARVTKTSNSANGTQGSGVQVLPNGEGGYQYIVGERGLRGYDKDNYWLKMKYDFDKSKNLTYAFGYYKYKGQTTGAKSYITDAAGNPLFSGSVQLPNGSWVNFSEGDFTDYVNRKEVLTHSFQYRDTENNLSLNLGLSDVRDAGYSDGDFLDKTKSGTMAEYPGKTYNLDFQKVWKDIGKHTIVAGFALRQDEMDYKNWKLNSWGNSSSKSSLNYDSGGKDMSSAIFIQDEYAFSKKFKLFSGLRFDQYDMKDGYSNWYTGTKAHIQYPSTTYRELSPKLGLEFQPNDQTSYYISYGHSFRPPDLYQLYRIGSYSNRAYYYVGNPNLKPETSNTFEIGLKKQVSKKLDLGVNLFLSDTDDAIVAKEYAAGTFPNTPDPTKNVKAYTNVESERRRGAEFSLNYKFDKKFNVFANYTWQSAEYATAGKVGQFVDDVPKHLIHVGINYNIKNWNLTLDGTYASQRNGAGIPTGIYDLSNDPYFVANFRIGYKVNSKVDLAFAVNNIFNREYYEEYLAPGRSWLLEARVKL